MNGHIVTMAVACELIQVTSQNAADAFALVAKLGVGW
jgi:hypothetical protein